MTSILNERVGSVCKRLGIELELDAKGNPSLVTLALIGVRFLPSQPEFQPRRRGRGRPKGTVRRSREDMAAIKFIEEYAVLRPDIKFEKLVGRAATFLERKGCTDWLERGLSPPQMVTTTAAYLELEDAVAAWIEDCAARDPNAFAKKTDLFASWSEWAGKSGEYVGSQKRFSQNLEARGFAPHRHRQLGRGFNGLRLPSPDYR